MFLDWLHNCLSNICELKLTSFSLLLIANDFSLELKPPLLGITSSLNLYKCLSSDTLVTLSLTVKGQYNDVDKEEEEEVDNINEEEGEEDDVKDDGDGDDDDDDDDDDVRTLTGSELGIDFIPPDTV